MAGNSRPSFLKRQKEQKRLERANAKRATRQARREARAERPAGEGAPIEPLELDVEDRDTEPEDAPGDENP